MHDPLLMEFSDRNDNLSSIELNHIFRESFLLLEDLIELSSVDEWHDKIKP